MDPTAAMATDGTNAAMIRHTMYQSDHIDYSWMILGLLGFVLVTVALRKVLWDKTSSKGRDEKVTRATVRQGGGDGGSR
jgi:hypothetical protein